MWNSRLWETSDGLRRYSLYSINVHVEHLSPAPRSSEFVFPVNDVAVKQAWDRLRKRAGLFDLTFHDLRHEAISRNFESGMRIPEVMAISGHQTASQLFRYVQVKSRGI
jgi:integrase